jgi:hypothetical protein
MNKMQEHLFRAGSDLGLQVVIPFEITLKSGRRVVAEALLPELGAPRGTVVFRSFDDCLNIHNDLKDLGYTCSAFGEPQPNELYEVESYKEMFAEWGWMGPKDKRPLWFDET